MPLYLSKYVYKLVPSDTIYIIYQFASNLCQNSCFANFPPKYKKVQFSEINFPESQSDKLLLICYTFLVHSHCEIYCNIIWDEICSCRCPWKVSSFDLSETVWTLNVTILLTQWPGAQCIIFCLRYFVRSHQPFWMIAWISDHMSNKVWDDITYPFSNFSGSIIEVWEWRSNLIPHFIMDMITYPCQDYS